MAQVLPGELFSFTGTLVNDREVRLDWSTATEHDNAGFEVWRMIEGETEFKEVGWVEGAGNSQQVIAYTHLDDNAANDISYYKLKQVDIDGQYEWSEVVAVEGASDRPALLIHPDPANSTVSLMGNIDPDADVYLSDGKGRVLRRWRPAEHHYVEELPTGMYVMDVQRADGTMEHGRSVIAR